ncbi:filamin-C-like protein [Leptotrombidium deliense]|uniref:Filamin-C-like protein n=1 Tax=Leptotrombidium deliense TaxID=299467 RepID=A0A443SQ14_9ACAR|nr:filamin-C-like protein [Leptotrombidium deliense]
MPSYNNFRSQIELVGEGLMRAEVGKPAVFHVLNSSGGGGCLSFSFDGPANVEYTKTRLDDGTVEVSYITKEAGYYEIQVFYANVHVPGSPAFVQATGELPRAEIPPELKKKIDKIRLYGRGLESGKPLALNKIVIDTHEAQIDKKELKVTMSSPRRRASIINLDDNKDGTYTLTYKPTDPGKYKLNVEVQDTPVPGSPFNINIRGGSIAEYF